jgi:isocitrate dehydrogenase (NAD+)
MESVRAVMDALGRPFDWDEQPAGLSAIGSHGDPLPASTLQSIRQNKLALKGPLTTPVGGGFKSVNVELRREFELFANLRPATTLIPGGRYDNIDITLVRENLDGFYAAFEHYMPVGDDHKAVAFSAGFNTRAGCQRIVRFAFEYAVAHGRKKVTIVHKANILKALTGIFLDAGRDIAKEYEGRVAMDERIVDACAMQLVLNPWQFDVIATTNLFGDILSDLIAGLIGGLGLAPGANIGANAAIFEAVHGSAPDIAGKGAANPAALLLAAAMMLDHAKLSEQGAVLREAVRRAVVDDGVRTRDLGGEASTQDVTRAIIRRIG